MAQVEIWTKPGCPFCERAMRLLDGKGVRYKEIIASQDPEIRAQMVKKSGGRNTFPQIFVNDAALGGCDDLYALEESGRLDEILAKAK